MKALLANNGKIKSAKTDKNALFVLRAERSLIQAGIKADEMDSEIAAVLQSTKVDVLGSTLKLSLSLDPDTVVSALED